jgi:hypothetical protein
MILAHELTHALQDQRFGLDRLMDESEERDSEAEFALRALVEGDASLLEKQYFEAAVAPHERLLLLRSTLGQALDVDWGLLVRTPRFIMDSMYFPYDEGETFVRALYDEGGWPAVDAAYADRPLSSEQILHPERYLDGDPPRHVPMTALTDTLGSRWRWVDEDIVGEFALRAHLTTAISPTLAALAAEGWGGDLYVVFHHDRAGETVLLWHTVWDSPEDADEFLNLYSLYLSNRFGNQDPYLVDDHDAAFGHAAETRVCWQARGDARCLWRAGEDAVSIVRAPRASLAERIFEAAGRAEEPPP